MVGAKEILDEKMGVIINGFDPDEWKNRILSLSRKDYNFSDQFIEKHHLSVDLHIQKKLEIWKRS